jgi:hypothetical protein
MKKLRWMLVTSVLTLSVVGAAHADAIISQPAGNYGLNGGTGTCVVKVYPTNDTDGCGTPTGQSITCENLRVEITLGCQGMDIQGNYSCPQDDNRCVGIEPNFDLMQHTDSNGQSNMNSFAIQRDMGPHYDFSKLN